MASSPSTALPMNTVREKQRERDREREVKLISLVLSVDICVGRDEKGKRRKKAEMKK